MAQTHRQFVAGSKLSHRANCFGGLVVSGEFCFGELLS